MKNTGKVFEENFRKSVPNNTFYYRFKDSATSWSNNGMTRFTITNIADCLLYRHDLGLFLIELKSIKGKSIPLAKIIGNKAKIKQINDLYEVSSFEGLNACIIVFFSDVERCFSLDIKILKEFIDSEDRKSIPIQFFEENGIEIKAIKKITNHSFDISNWLCNF